MTLEVNSVIWTDTVSRITEEHNKVYTSLVSAYPSAEDLALIEIENDGYDEEMRFIKTIQQELLDKMRERGCNVDEYIG